MKHVLFQGVDCSVQIGTYKNGQPSIQLFDEEGPFATATICLVNQELPQNHVGIKDYSENEGMLSALVEAGIVRDTKFHVQSGLTRVSIVEVLV
jgi:hypothetical protein